jgi:DNA-binding Lrp family transcriptional regulator
MCGAQSLDATDVEIVKLLIRDCRISFQELSKKIGITRSAVKKRVDKLVEFNVVYKFVARLSSAMTNMEYALAVLDFKSPPNEENLQQVLSKSPSITQFSKTFDGRFCVFGVYFSSDELSELTTLLWSLSDLRDVNLYPKFIHNRGGEMKLTGVHMKILRCLMEDARMSITDISDRTGLTARRVTKSLNQMKESEAVHFTIRLTENVADRGTEVVTKVVWDVNKTTRDEVMQYLENEFRENYIAADPLATEPTIWISFTVNHVRGVDDLTKRLLQSEFITSVDSMILYPEIRFSDPRTRKLDQVLTDAGY